MPLLKFPNHPRTIQRLKAEMEAQEQAWQAKWDSPIALLLRLKELIEEAEEEESE